jgi:hypothetical protein
MIHEESTRLRVRFDFGGVEPAEKGEWLRALLRDSSEGWFDRLLRAAVQELDFVNEIHRALGQLEARGLTPKKIYYDNYSQGVEAYIDFGPR